MKKLRLLAEIRPERPRQAISKILGRISANSRNFFISHADFTYIGVIRHGEQRQGGDFV